MKCNPDYFEEEISASIRLQPVSEPLTIDGSTYVSTYHRKLTQKYLEGNNHQVTYESIFHILESLSEHPENKSYYVVRERTDSPTYSYSELVGIFGWKRKTLKEAHALIDSFEVKEDEKDLTGQGTLRKCNQYRSGIIFGNLKTGETFKFTTPARTAAFFKCDLSNVYKVLQGKTRKIRGWQIVG